MIFSIFVVIVFVLSYNFTRQNNFMNGTFLFKTLCPLYVAELGQRTEASCPDKKFYETFKVIPKEASDFKSCEGGAERRLYTVEITASFVSTLGL